MSEAERGDSATPFPSPVGERLRQAREAKGLSLAEVAARTRVPLRHLEAIETSNFSGLPSATYAVGFVRAYARAIDADEVTLARDVRAEVAQADRPRPQYQPYEVADPARVPSRGLVIVATGIGLAIAVLAVLWFATGLWRGGETTAAPDTPSVAVAVPAASPTARPVTGGQVTIAAGDTEVWMRVYDAQDKTLYLGTLKPGEKFDVPAEADNPMINVGRPDQLRITLNGSAVPPLGDGKRAIKDVPVGAAALAARASGEPAPSASTAPLVSASPSASPSTPSAFASATPRRTDTRTPARRSEPTRTRPRPTASASARGPENLLPSGFSNANQ